MNDPLLTRALLLRPDRIRRRLERFVDAGLVERAPTPWQLTLGVLRMWHRLLFDSGDIGKSDVPVRTSWRARVFSVRPFRFPFLLAERAITPWDLTGLVSEPDRIASHLVAAYHAGEQFLYDFELLADHPEILREVADTAAAIADGRHPRADWLADLTVHDGYHATLARAADAYLDDPEAAGRPYRDDPDVSFLGYLRWCAAQPATPTATVAALRRSAPRVPAC